MRNQFRSAGEIAIADLQLDQANPRFGWLENQSDCIEIMFEEYGTDIVSIAIHIATHGLSPDPIVVDIDDGRFVVKEGNRRVVALKILNNPNEAPENMRATFFSIKQSANINAIPKIIECITAPRDVIQEYVALRHLGAQGGAGLVVWGPRGQENYRGSRGQKLTYPQASSITKYLENNEIGEAKKVPLSNLQRIIQSKYTMEKIGLRWEQAEPVFDDEGWALVVLKEICLDFSERGKRVKDIYTSSKIEHYINEVLSRPAILLTPKRAGISPEEQPKLLSSPSGATSSPPTAAAPASEEKTARTPAKARQPKPIWDREYIFPKRKVYFTIPDTEAKAKNILSELAELKVIKTPISIGVLLRSLIEISIKWYIKQNNIKCATPADAELRNQIIHAANHMHEAQLIDDKYRKALANMGNSQELLSVASMHDWVHNPKITPSPQSLCIFWNNIEPFIRNCWHQ